MNWLQRFCLHCIERYQRNGGGENQFRVDCNFTPTCSEYTRQAILRYGALKGCWRGWLRIRRCNQRDLVGKIHDPLK
ncbi:membrane protein insertion efficiency factor YidD [Marinomonas fungiae]|uniref:membrane protein insertion efficiency factor YidD n=1 Tax=Marinomonas fungiae TaxID=1137284 RepID=UPI003A94E42C